MVWAGMRVQSLTESMKYNVTEICIIHSLEHSMIYTPEE